MLTIAGFLFFFGLRGFVAWDWYGYYPFYQELPKLFYGNIIKYATTVHMEIGFVTYSSIIKLISSNYHFFIFMSVFIDVFLLNIFFRRHTKYYVLGFIGFIAIQGLTNELDLMRNIKSILLFLVSIKYLQERKPLPYFFLNLLGLSFHITSILYLPLYFFFHKTISKKWFIILFVIGNIIFFMNIQYIKPIILFISELIGGRVAEKVPLYIANYTGVSIKLTIGYIQRTLMAVIIILYYRKLSERHGLFINAFVSYFVLFFYLHEILILADRISNLFIYSYWILFPALLEHAKLRYNKHIVLISILLFCYYKTYVNSSNIFYKYDNVLFKHDSFEQRKEIFDRYSDSLAVKNKE
jgi:hypothetical protein